MLANSGRFATAMKEGDTVVLPRKQTSQVALGRVIGPYKYQTDQQELRHTRPVNGSVPTSPEAPLPKISSTRSVLSLRSATSPGMTQNAE